MEQVEQKLHVWYSPELDMIVESTKESGYLFKDESGELHLHFNLSSPLYRPFHVFKFYLVGEL